MLSIIFGSCDYITQRNISHRCELLIDSTDNHQPIRYSIWGNRCTNHSFMEIHGETYAHIGINDIIAVFEWRT